MASNGPELTAAELAAAQAAIAAEALRHSEAAADAEAQSAADEQVGELAGTGVGAAAGQDPEGPAAEAVADAGAGGGGTATRSRAGALMWSDVLAASEQAIRRPRQTPRPGRGGAGRTAEAFGTANSGDAPAEPSPGSGEAFTMRDLVEALRAVGSGSANAGVTAADLNKSEKPKWQKGEQFFTFSHRVEMWTVGHGLRHLLDLPPNALETQLHDAMKLIIVMQLPPYDLDYVADCGSVCEVWHRLTSKYMPSKKTELKSLQKQFADVYCKDENVPRHTENVHTLVNKLRALGHHVTNEEIAEKICDIPKDRRYEIISLHLQNPSEYEKGADHVSRTLCDYYCKLKQSADRSGGGMLVVAMVVAATNQVGEANGIPKAPRLLLASSRPSGKSGVPAITVARWGTFRPTVHNWPQKFVNFCRPEQSDCDSSPAGSSLIAVHRLWLRLKKCMIVLTS